MINLTERLEIFEKLLLCSGNLFLWKYTPDLTLECTNCPDADFFKKIFAISSCSSLLKEHIANSSLPILLEDEQHLMWIAAPYYKEKFLQSIYLIGPVFSSSVSETRIVQQLQTKTYSLEFKKNLIARLRILPIIPVYSFLDHGTMLYWCLYENYITVNDISSHIQDVEESDLLSPEDGFHATRHETSRQTELFYASIVRDGNLNYRSLLKNFHKWNHPSPGILSSEDPLRQAKNEIIILSVIISRAAIEGGYPAENALTLSDYYIQSIEREETIPGLYTLGGNMLDTFIRKVHQYKQFPETSVLIKQCVAYLELHIMDSLDLSQLAHTLGYDKYYLSKRFKKEMGVSITTYFRSLQIDYSKILLKDNAYKISDISELLHFSTPSHFTASFRAVTGMTPREFQKK